MMWDKPFELLEEEYQLIFKCLKLKLFDVQYENNCVSTYRKSTGELVFFHFFPKCDDINYNNQNINHTYYQASDLSLSEQKTPEEMPNELTLTDPYAIQLFLNEVIRLQKEAENEAV